MSKKKIKEIRDLLHLDKEQPVNFDDHVEWRLPDGTVHRTSGPAIEYLDGRKIWVIEGVIHRDDGPAVEYPDGSKEWYIRGRLHREDGPAIEYSQNHLEWYNHGKRHREDGPAVIFIDGDEEFWIDGILVTKPQFMKKKKSYKK